MLRQAVTPERHLALTLADVGVNSALLVSGMIGLCLDGRRPCLRGCWSVHRNSEEVGCAGPTYSTGDPSLVLTAFAGMFLQYRSSSNEPGAESSLRFLTGSSLGLGASAECLRL